MADLASFAAAVASLGNAEVQQQRPSGDDTEFSDDPLQRKSAPSASARRWSHGHPRPLDRSLQTPVALDVIVWQTWGADIRDESFRAELKIKARWLCPPEHAGEAILNGSDALDWDWEPEWIPRIAVENATERIDESPRAFVAWREEGGGAAGAGAGTGESIPKAASAPAACHAESAQESENVKTWIAGEWTFAVRIFERYDLRDFPFDLQDLNIHIRVDNAPSIELRSLVRSPMKAGTEDSNLDGEEPVRIDVAGCEVSGFRPLWLLGGGDNDELQSTQSGRGRTQALYRLLKSDRRVHIVLLYEREPWFHVVNYIVLLAAITAAAIVGWSVPFFDVASRLSLDVTLLLTSVAFKQVLAETVPPIKYLTLLDKYAFGSFALLVLATFLHAAIGWLIDECDADGNCTFRVDGSTQDSVRRLDRILLWVYFVVFGVANCAYAALVSRRRGRGRENFSWEAAHAQGFRSAGITPLRHHWNSADRVAPKE